MDIKLISPKKESIYRVRLGKYRLVYEIDETNKTISLTMFFIRGKGYWQDFDLVQSKKEIQFFLLKKPVNEVWKIIVFKVVFLL